MIYPEFIKKGDTIGVTAPSAGSENEIDIKKEAVWKFHTAS